MIKTIIIPSYNGLDLVKRCVDSINRQSSKWKIIIVDNNSSDGTAVAKFGGNDVLRINNKRNLGFGMACNVGINYAINIGSDVVGIINQDAVVQGAALDVLADIVTARDDVAIACPVLIESEESMSNVFASRVISQNKGVLDDAMFSAIKEEYDVKYINAACWVFNVGVLVRLGGFDPVFFMYGEDIEYASRVEYYGYRMILSTKATVCHNTEFRGDRKRIGGRVYWSSIRSSSSMLATMRGYRRPYWRNIPNVIRMWWRSLSANVYAVNFEMTLAQFIALLRFVALVSKNSRNHRRCAVREQGVFLDVKGLE